MATGKQQGQSAATIDKERGLGSVFSVNMQISSKASRRFPYWHLDANAGTGWNGDVGVYGSPVVFHKVADDRLIGRQRKAFFCDNNPRTVIELKKQLPSYWPSDVWCCDNEVAVERFADLIRRAENPRHAIGDVIIDPNGYWYRNQEGQGPPIKSVLSFSREFLCIDIIVNLNTGAYKRLEGTKKFDILSPRDVLMSLNKKHWLVKLTHAAGQQFLLAVGRNLKTGDHRKLGFFSLDSDEGHDIMLRAEGKRQHNLFEEELA